MSTRQTSGASDQTHDSKVDVLVYLYKYYKVDRCLIPRSKLDLHDAKLKRGDFFPEKDSGQAIWGRWFRQERRLIVDDRYGDANDGKDGFHRALTSGLAMTSPRERIGQPEFSCLGQNDLLSIKSRPCIGVVVSLIVFGIVPCLDQS